MADANSALPIRSELPGQVSYTDIITKLGDATNPTTQQASVDTFGSQSAIIKDTAGNAIGDQLLSASYWLQVVDPATGPAAPGTAASFSQLIGGIYNSTPPTLTTGQQSSLQLDAAGRLLVDAVITFPYDTNYGTVDATTLRTAAQIGNATGAANFNYGAVGAQTLRVASQIGNATGSADFGAGATDAQTLRVSANQGTAAALAGAWPMEITDGTNGPAAVKAASTAAIATDPALVVALSPNSPLPTGTNTIGTVNVSNLPTTVDTNYGTVGASTIRTAAQIGNATGAADFNNGATDAQTLRVAANLAVAGANVTSANPVPVTLVSSVPGTNIQSYYTAASLAAGSSTTFTYTVPATHTFSLERVWASASGKIKAVIANNAATIFVGFNSTANPNIDITVVAPPTIVAGNTVTVTITNNDLLAFDVYATIEGNQPS
jgi:hypothetical protein